MEHLPHRTTEPGFLEDINYRILAFVNAFTLALYASGLLVVVGLVLRYYEVTGGNFLFLLGMFLLVLLFTVQIGLSFLYIVSNLRLGFLGAFSSLALTLGFLALLFRYQAWWGWQVLFFLAVPLYMLSSIFLGMHLSRRRTTKPQQRKFLYRNLLIPFLFLLVLALLSFSLHPDPSRRLAETFEVFKTSKVWIG